MSSGILYYWFWALKDNGKLVLSNAMSEELANEYLATAPPGKRCGIVETETRDRAEAKAQLFKKKRLDLDVAVSYATRGFNKSDGPIGDSDLQSYRSELNSGKSVEYPDGPDKDYRKELQRGTATIPFRRSRSRSGEEL